MNKVSFHTCYFIPLLFIVLLSCASGEHKSDVKADAVIEFDTVSHDFGTLKSGEIASFSFKYKNVGNGHLIIKSIKSSCGCTTTKYTRKPLQKGESGFVEVQFDSKNRHGRQFKSITVQTNAVGLDKQLFVGAIVN